MSTPWILIFILTVYPPLLGDKSTVVVISYFEKREDCIAERDNLNTVSSFVDDFACVNGLPEKVRK